LKLISSLSYVLKLEFFSTGVKAVSNLRMSFIGIIETVSYRAVSYIKSRVSKNCV